MNQSKKTIILYFFQAILIIATVYYIFSSIKKFDFSYRININSKFILFVCITFILMIINWLLEILKWQYLNKEEEISFSLACKSVFVGLLVGQLSPNRVAEPFARGLVLPKNNYYKTTINATIGSFFQSIPTFTCGLLSLFFLVLNIKIYQFKIIIFISIAILAVLCIILFLFKKKIKYFFNTHKTLIIKKESDILLKVLILSFSRYFIFILQNYLIFKSLKTEISFMNVFVVSSSIYFITSFLPSFLLLDLGTRGSLSVFLYSFFINNIKGIIFVTYFVWFINIVIPIIFTIPFLKRVKINFFETLKPIKIWIFRN